MTLITNAAGREIDLDAATPLMDEAIVRSLHHGDGMSEQEFFEIYCLRHKRKFNQEFEPNKANPVW